MTGETQTYLGIVTQHYTMIIFLPYYLLIPFDGPQIQLDRGSHAYHAPFRQLNPNPSWPAGLVILRSDNGFRTGIQSLSASRMIIFSSSRPGISFRNLSIRAAK